MRKILIFFLIWFMGSEISAQMPSQLISPSDAEQLFNRQMREIITSLRQNGNQNLQVDWDTFTCSPDLTCVSPSIVVREGNIQQFHLNDTTFILHSVTPNKGRVEFSTLFALDEGLIEQLEMDVSSPYAIIKPFIPSKLSCMTIVGIDGASSLSENNIKCSIVTPSADYTIAFGIDFIHPIYQGENFISTLKDEQGKFKNDSLITDNMDQASIGLRQIALKIQSKSLPQAIYQLAHAFNPELTPEVWNATIEQLLGEYSDISTQLLQDNSTLSRQEKQQFNAQLNRFNSGIAEILTGSKKELILNFYLKKSANLKKFSDKELSDPDIIMNYYGDYNFNVDIQ